MVHGVLLRRMYSVQDYSGNHTSRSETKTQQQHSVTHFVLHHIAHIGHDACLAANTGTLAGDIGHEDKDSP